jgi:transcriptional regulator with GAF, ATPase, and Fis domain
MTAKRKGGRSPGKKEFTELVLRAEEALSDWNPVQARELLAKALKQLPRNARNSQKADLHFKMGRALSLSGHLNEAIKHFKKSKELAGDGPLALQVDRSIALSTLQLGSVDDAMNLLEKLKKTYERREDHEGLAWTRVKQSSVLNAMGRTEEALKTALEALGLARIVKSPMLESQAQLEIGWIKARQGDLNGAQSALKESLRIQKRIQDPVEISSASNNLGLVLWYAGDLNGALTYLNRALEIQERMGDLRMMARVFNNIGLVHFDRGDWDTALGHFQQSLNLGERSKDASTLKSPFVNLGLIQAERGDFERALSSLKKGLKAAETLGDGLVVARIHVYASAIHLRRGRPERAERELREAERRMESLQSPLLLAEALNQSARLHLARDEIEEAHTKIQESLRIAETHGLRGLLSEAKRLECEIHRKAGRSEDARASAEASLAVSLELGTPLEEALARRTLGKLCLDSKDVLEATRQLRKSTEILTRLRATYYLSKNFILMAWAMEHTGDLADARTQMEDAARAFEDIGLDQVALEARKEGEQLVERQRETEMEAPIGFEGIIGRSPKMQEVFSLVERVADTDAGVLILGESGTGKELLARTLHRLSPRRDEAFVTVNCAALPESLVESELFGIEKGTATGVEKRIGKFQQAHRGTLFLDEIGDMSLPVQAKVLRVIEGSEFEPVGGRKPVQVDVRVIAATNKDLRSAIESGDFREDLFHRLNVVTLDLPPLRERPGDILLLIDNYVQVFADRYGRDVRQVSDKAIELLQSYSWPGNVRQLENAVERGVVLARTEILEVEDLPREVSENRVDIDVGAPRTYQELLQAKKKARTIAVQQLEREFLLRSLTRNNWNVSRAAQETNMDRRQFHNLMKQHDIRRPKRA